MSPRKQNPSDPTDERTAEQSTQSASGLSGGRNPQPPSQGEGEDVLNRNAQERYDTPRQYEEEDDGFLPSRRAGPDPDEC